METMTDSTTLEILQATRRLLATEDHWCKDAFAMNAKGQATTVGADDAVAYCLRGALARANREVTGVFAPSDAWRAAERAVQAQLTRRSVGIYTFNDRKRTKHADVLAVLDKAIEVAS